MTSPASHWDGVYAQKAPEETSWHEPDATVSLRLLREAASAQPGPRRAIDIGAGRSPLARALLADGWRVSVLDCSAVALADAPAGAERIVADILAWDPDGPYDLWHDRAVLHFLVDDSDRARYATLAAAAVAPGGIAVIGCFALDGPEQCSGLPVRRASADELAACFADGFVLERAERETHVTPWGAEQVFTWVVLRRLSPA